MEEGEERHILILCCLLLNEGVVFFCFLFESAKLVIRGLGWGWLVKFGTTFFFFLIFVFLTFSTTFFFFLLGLDRCTFFAALLLLFLFTSPHVILALRKLALCYIPTYLGFFSKTTLARLCSTFRLRFFFSSTIMHSFCRGLLQTSNNFLVEAVFYLLSEVKSNYLP